MQARKPLKRGRGQTRAEHPRFLVYCEDQNAGVDYFTGLRADLRAQLKIGPQHGEPLGLVKAAIDHQTRAPHRREDRFKPYDEVWCVMDVEAPEPHSSLEVALQLAGQSGIQVALANPCFELWVMLHFESVTAYHSSRQMQAILEHRNHCGYSICGKSIDYQSLRDRYATARANALDLRRDSSRRYQSNPWTDIDELAERIRRGMAT